MTKSIHRKAIEASQDFEQFYVNSVANKFYMGYKQGAVEARKEVAVEIEETIRLLLMGSVDPAIYLTGILLKLQDDE